MINYIFQGSCKKPPYYAFILLIFVLACQSQNFAHADISKNDFPHKTIIVGDAKLDVMVADTDQTRIQGLQNQDKLDYQQGMLFIVPNPQVIPIWMPNMKFSLDILWFDENGKILHIEKNVPPCTSQDLSTCSIYYQNGLPAKYVLEATSGFVDNTAITMDSRLGFPIPEFGSVAGLVVALSISLVLAVRKLKFHKNFFQ